MDKRDKGSEWGKETREGNAQKVPPGSACFFSPQQREVWWQPWPLSDKRPQKNHFRWVIELVNCKNRRKALCWGQQRGEGTIPLLKGRQRWRNVPVLSRCLHFPFCCWRGSVMVHITWQGYFLWITSYQTKRKAVGSVCQLSPALGLWTLTTVIARLSRGHLATRGNTRSLNRRRTPGCTHCCRLKAISDDKFESYVVNMFVK